LTIDSCWRLALAEQFFASLIVGILIGLALFYGVRQWLALRALRRSSQHPSGELAFHRNQARRRLLTCFLMLTFASILATSYILGYERLAVEMGDKHEPPIPDDVRDAFLRQYQAIWGTLLFLLFAMVVLALVDLFAIQRYTRLKLRKLHDDRRAALDRQIQIFRSERNGHP
jgi:uncharacterized protein (DUF2062 family)